MSHNKTMKNRLASNGD